MAIRCPRCDRDMVVEEHCEVPLDICGKCDGWWFDADELETTFHRRRSKEPLLPTRPEEPDVVIERDGTDCPRCATPTLDRHRWEGMTYRRCSRCSGVFLRRAEREAVAGVAFLKSGHLIKHTSYQDFEGLKPFFPWLFFFG